MKQEYQKLYAGELTCRKKKSVGGSDSSGSDESSARIHFESPGDYDCTMVIDGRKRTYRVHLPTGFKPCERLPLVIMMHGGQMTGIQMERITGLSGFADKNNFAVVYPDAIGIYKGRLYWNDSRVPEVDDVAFISALIDELIEKANIDPRCVYVTGYSNGGGIANFLGVAISDKIAAIAPVAGTIVRDMDKKWQPKRPVPVLYFHGTADQLAYYEGGTAGTFRGSSLSAEQHVQWWAKKNCCNSEPVCKELKKDPSGLSVKRYIYGKGRRTAKVVFYRIEGGGHTWPGRPEAFPVKIYGKTAINLNANKIIWRFFKNYKLPDDTSNI